MRAARQLSAATVSGTLLRRCRRVADVAQPASSPLPPHTVARRSYYWPYPEDLVPEGATPSLFQSSPVPSVRDRIVREYALSPLFGSRTPCCVLGFAGVARDVVGSKASVRRWVAQALGKAVDDVELGALQQVKEMMLHRSGTDKSPRLADELHSSPDAALRRRTRFARLPAQTRTLVEVYLAGEEDAAAGEDDHDDVVNSMLAHGMFLQAELRRHMEAVAAPLSPSSPATTAGSSDASGALDDDDDVRRCVAALHDECGVILCAVPAVDASEFHFDRLHGEEVTGETAERVMDRWTRRLVQQHEAQQQ
ncbi:hypothetical protein NESM_000331800 [Novymonas esmeraldas]|uniref:Uncharacterized protein n=1 Tax=Novymonas esmeraldas TaxID=1808958 RepID=A0AAW0ELC0_9TRYP